MSDILDDMDSRPGSTTSLLRTIIGIYLRELDGWIAVAHLLELMEALGVPAPRTRTALARVKKKGLLVPEQRNKVAGYSLAPSAVTMLDRGDRRIYHPRYMQANSSWCVVSFSIPEEHRQLRHQLRRRLLWIGCGNVSPALWVCPAYLIEEVEEILDDLSLRDYSTLFITERPRVAGELADAVAAWWDLDALREYHEAFLAEHSGHDECLQETSPSDAFSIYIRAIDSWRIIPYVDPGLPIDLLPQNWPGNDSSELFLRLRRQFGELSAVHVSQVTGMRIADPASSSMQLREAM